MIAAALAAAAAERSALDALVREHAGPFAAALLASTLCGLLGSFLVLRRASMLGDAVSHAVLPGLVGGFLLFQTRSPLAMLGGALVAGAISVALIGLVRRLGRVEAGAAMGVVFAGMFALGVLMLQTGARNVDLDPDCVLYGNLDTILWPAARDAGSLLSGPVLLDAPRQVLTLAVLLALAAGLVAVFWKILRLASFDPALSDALGFPSWLVLGSVTMMVAAAAVGAFEAVGSILVIAMLVCPAVAARQLTDRLRTQVLLSTAIGASCGAIGYALAVAGPGWVGLGDSVSGSGTIAAIGGAAVVLAAVFSPSRGVLARRLRNAALRDRAAIEDLLAHLYRLEEARAGVVAAPRPSDVEPAMARRAARLARRDGLITAADQPGSTPALTDSGRHAAREIVRSHRLWESYLVDQAGHRPDHVHRAATELEHLRRAPDGQRLAPPGPPWNAEGPGTDPHGKPIP